MICPHCGNETDSAVTLVTIRGAKQKVHSSGELVKAYKHGTRTDRKIKEVPLLMVMERDEPIDCVVGRGGVIAMSPLIVHASSKIVSDEPRRVLHIEYARSMEIMDGVWLRLA